MYRVSGLNKIGQPAYSVMKRLAASSLERKDVPVPHQIDHIVIISPDLNTAVDNARHAGFTVVPGGTHSDGRTHNALIGFADGSYIELIAPKDASAEGDHRWFARLRDGGGLVDFCLLGEKLTQETAAIRARDVDYPDPSALGRNRPDGQRIDWLLSIPAGAVGESGWPFLIEDLTSRDLRVPHEAAEITHENGVQGIAGITVLVKDLATSTREYEAILGTPARNVSSPFADDMLGAILPISENSSQWIMLVQPGAETAMEHLEAHGQGPYRVTLRTHDGAISPGDGKPLDPSHFSGARIMRA